MRNPRAGIGDRQNQDADQAPGTVARQSRRAGMLRRHCIEQSQQRLGVRRHGNGDPAPAFTGRLGNGMAQAISRHTPRCLAEFRGRKEFAQYARATR